LLEAETRAEAVQREFDKRIPGFEIPPPKHQGAPETGVVRYVAADITSVKPGDKVQFKFTQRGFEIDGQKLIRVKIEDVLAIIEGE
jgi:co-chaperonin GroES (HSP10)